MYFNHNTRIVAATVAFFNGYMGYAHGAVDGVPVPGGNSPTLPILIEREVESDCETGCDSEVEVGVGLCTATVVAPGLMITSAHCVPPDMVGEEQTVYVEQSEAQRQFGNDIEADANYEALELVSVATRVLSRGDPEDPASDIAVLALPEHLSATHWVSIARPSDGIDAMSVVVVASGSENGTAVALINGQYRMLHEGGPTILPHYAVIAVAVPTRGGVLALDPFRIPEGSDEVRRSRIGPGDSGGACITEQGLVGIIQGARSGETFTPIAVDLSNPKAASLLLEAVANGADISVFLPVLES